MMKRLLLAAAIGSVASAAAATPAGTYSPEAFRLNIALTTTNGIPLRGNMTAQRVSASCPIGSPGS